ncbi:MAG: hypothetical protein IJY14_03680 [Acholeplasmatales bacterium]|nr:hypothetical protein [Acholeplasmatales bacterium]
MAFWSKKKMSDSLNRYFNDNKATLNIENDIISFELYLDKGYTLYPYISLDEENDNVSFLINLREVNDKNIYEKINQFNLKSMYLVAKLNEDKILLLEYNFKAYHDNINEIIDNIIKSIFDLQEDIDSL